MNPKPPRGEFLRERRGRSARRRVEERVIKDQCRARDRDDCRWRHRDPDEREACRRAWKEVAHLRAKGMGGDKLMTRTQRPLMATVCAPVHQGPGSMHAGARRVVPLTERMADGPMAYERKVNGEWVEEGRDPDDWEGY